ncbi:MAG TPA: hypothetical protein DCM28_09165 [Phycisphaerales bacterium]|nr:hypothetical protein [Phycisphaerales bacterium]HCD34494.1 hypothetical protein [Phycisphaerales bacterium]|tara:strand:+ start:108 stop:509 length:402 start_codon:yes stop_codon:yes gene_type:complete
MKRLFQLTTVLFVSGLIGCSNTASLSSNTTIQNTKHIQIKAVTTQQQDNALVIQGSIERDRLYRGNMHGHVMVSVLDAAGTAIDQKTVAYSTTSLLPEGIRRTPFSVTLPGVSESSNRIVLQLHKRNTCECDV